MTMVIREEGACTTTVKRTYPKLGHAPGRERVNQKLISFSLLRLYSTVWEVGRKIGSFALLLNCQVVSTY